MKRHFTLLFFLSFSFLLQSQNTMGLISYDDEKSSDGYNLFFPHGQGTAYLLNNCGEIVNQWDDPNFKPGNGVYLTEEGNVFMCKGNLSASNPDITAGGGGEKIELRDWDNNLLWEFTYNTSTYRLHHDIALLPNGNVLAIAWELKDYAASIQAGRNPGLISQNELWPDHIIEVQVGGDNSGDIVWEWHAWDHLIQDFDPTKDNYGIVSDHPEKINLNYESNSGNADWLHMNSIDYNEDLDQIIISVPTFSEVWIIDHSTTSAEAAGSTGGNSGKGGDLLYRWGNPQAYDNGTEADRKLFYQHDAHWIGQGLDEIHEDYGKIAVYNNRITDEISNVNIFNPIFSETEGYSMIGNVFAPNDFEWTYNHPNPDRMYSNILSSVQRLANGNTLITSGRNGYVFEITPDEGIVWEYINPIQSGNAISQGDVAPTGMNLMFAMKRYAPDFEGFVGKDLSPNGYIELNPNTDYCNFLIDVDDVNSFSNVSIYPNPSSDIIHIGFEGDISSLETIEVYDILGNLMVHRNHIQDSRIEISAKDWPNGMYILRLNGVATRKVMVVK